MKRAILIISMLLAFNVALADETEKATCLYEGKPYTIGSIIEMVGVMRECRDGRYEHSQRIENNKGQDTYIPPSAYDHALTWRVPVSK